MAKITNILSLFDGLSCGQIALNRVGIVYDNYFASEIDKHAIKVTMKNYPNTIQLGDITKVKVKLLCLSEVYSYICNYDSNLQSNISEWEVLYWLNKNFTFSAKIRTQKPNERQEVSESSIIQRIEEVWFSNREMGSIRKFGDYTRSGSDGEENDIRIPQQLQCGKWRYDNDIYRRYKEENIGIAIRETQNRNSEKKNIGNIEETFFKKRESKSCFRENEKSNVEKRCSGELFEGEGKDRFSRKVKKEKRNGRAEENSFIDEVVRELCGWDETDGIAQDYWNILRLHKEEQVTVVEYEGGYHIFKGKIDLCIGGSPCQGFSFSGKQLNFDDPRSKLFFEFVRLVKELKPKYWLLENVVMKKEYEQVISEYLGVQPVKINSSLVSAQNRERLYWANFEIKQPTNKGINLIDILETDYLINPSAIRGRRLNKATILGRRLNERGVRDDYNKDVPITQCLEVRATNTNKSNCLTTVEKDNVLTTMPIGRHKDAFKNKLPFRYYTLKEYCRLQTVPENYFTDIVSESQAKKMLGNGWTVDVITHIFGSLLNGA